MQTRWKVAWIILLLVAAALAVGLWQLVQAPQGAVYGGFSRDTWLLIVAGVLGSSALLAGYLAIIRQLGRRAYRLRSESQLSEVPTATTDQRNAQQGPETVASYMAEQYGRNWRRRVHILLVVGDSAQVKALAAQLCEKQWLVSEGTLLLWAGNLQQRFDSTIIDVWRPLFRWRAPDAVVWALSRQQCNDAAAMGAGAHRLRDLAILLGWRLPLHLWQVGDSEWPQDARAVEPVGCVLPSPLAGRHLQHLSTGLGQALRNAGMAQLHNDLRHDFLLRLSRDLQADGPGRWQTLLDAIKGRPAILLCGVWFSLPAVVSKRPEPGHYWQADTSWSALLGECLGQSKPLGLSLPRVTPWLILALLAIWGIGLLSSFASNRIEIARLQGAMVAVQHAPAGNDTLAALGELTRELSRLAYRSEHGTPWYQRFGLDRTQALRELAWPSYVQASQRLLRDPAAKQLHEQLRALVNLPAGSAARASQARGAYDQLKAYLMLARPEKAEADFLVRTLGADQPAMWAFYAQHLPSHPAWRIEADLALVAQVRQVLLGQLGQRNAEAALYQQAIATAGNHYPAVGLQQMVGETDAAALFSTTASVPGVYTRQAWEGHVRAAIEEAAKARREEIDWVLSDSPADLAAELSPEQLEERLTARYFEAYGRAWLDMLNSLRWRQHASLDEVIAQLALMSDARQSPLIALMNTLAFQGQAGTRGQAMAASLLKSAQQLIGQEPAALVEPLAQGTGGPLEGSFGPLLALLGKGPQVPGDDRLSLQTFLTRVTAVRLKLQQVSNAADPQAMTQALAQTVFQGKQLDLADTRAYGGLVAASLGDEWAGAAQALFVQPLDQAWQRVLQPSAAGLNRDWQRSVVNDWQAAFSGRYPFSATGSGASLPMLGQMIRADSGRIEQFLRGQLGGLLRKEGSRWVVNPEHGQGLRLNPQFLAAINQLTRLADVLYTDGGMGMAFELRGKPVRDVVQTRFTLDGEQHHYFNQRERWQRFRWPGQGDHPGTSLTWTSVQGGEHLFADYPGAWGLVRLLDRAQVTPLDDLGSRYRLVLQAPDGSALTWHLRTELGAGPLALLELRNFSLPGEIFVVQGQGPQRFAHHEGLQ